VLSAEQDELLLQEFRKGYRSFLTAAQEHQATFGQYELHERSPAQLTANIPSTANSEGAETVPYQATVEDYLAEGQRGELWAAKTISEKRDALELLGNITNNNPIAKLTKSDARSAKATLSKLPKNRSKNPRTRNLCLADMQAVERVEKMSTRTVNGYLSAFQSFNAWAVNNGHADENVFSGLRIPQKTRDKTKQRAAFDAAQLATLFRHLTTNPDKYVNKEEHKWPTLIAMFTGARLNEVAQLHTTDIREQDGIWIIDINDDDGKMLKTAASRRIVPVHQQLLVFAT